MANDNDTRSIRVPTDKLAKWLALELESEGIAHGKDLYTSLDVIAKHIGVAADALEMAIRTYPERFDIVTAAQAEKHNTECGGTFTKATRKRGKGEKAQTGYFPGVKLLDAETGKTRVLVKERTDMAAERLVDIIGSALGSPVSITPTAYGFSVAFEDEGENLATSADAVVSFHEAVYDNLVSFAAPDETEEPKPVTSQD